MANLYPISKRIFALLIASLMMSDTFSQCPAPPTVVSPITYCLNATASQLTATGTNLSWGGSNSSVGGTATLTSGTYVDNNYNNKKLFFTANGSVTIHTIDYFIPANQTANGIVLGIFNALGTVIATSSTTTTRTAGSTAINITNTFNFILPGAGNYSIGLTSGSGNIGSDNPSFPITESSGTITLTSAPSRRCYNNIVFSQNNGGAPVPATNQVGSTTYYVTQTANGCTSAAATIIVNVVANAGASPVVTSPVNYCQNTTAVPLTATGSNLVWGGENGSVGGNAVLTAVKWVASDVSNNRKTYFTTTTSLTISTIDYYIPAYESVSNLVLGLFNGSGTLIATSSTSTTRTAGSSAVKITNDFGYTISTPGNYSIGVVSGSGNVGGDSPSFPLTESTGSISVTSALAGIRCFNNIMFSKNSSPTAPTPSTITLGSTNYYVSQVVNGCTSLPATIVVNIAATGGTPPSVTSPVNYCQNNAAIPLTATGSNLLWSGAPTQSSVGGTATPSSQTWLATDVSNNKKVNFTTTVANITIKTVDYFILANNQVTNLVLAIFDSAGNKIATSTTSTTRNAGATTVRIMNDFNFTIVQPGRYSIGVSSGSGNAGYDSPSYPITESSGAVKVTGVSSSPFRCFKNIIFTINSSSTAPTPLTTSTGTTNYTVTQTVNGCTSPPATIVVNVGASTPLNIVYSGSPFCGSITTPQAVALTGTGGGTYSAPPGLAINVSSGAITPSASIPGTYTVTYSVNNFGCISTATRSVTVVENTPPTFNYPGITYCNNPGTAVVNFSGAAGGTFTSSAGLSLNPLTGSVNLAASTLGNYIVTYSVSSGVCPTFTTTAPVSIGAAGTWTGNINSDCSNSGNWYCGEMPTSATNIIIPAGCINYPVVTGIISANDIRINNGATLTVTGTLKIAGTINNNGTLNMDDGELELTGNVAQVLLSNSFENNAVKNLVINNQSVAGVSLQGTLDIYGSLNFSGTGMIFNTNDSLALKSTPGGTATVGVMTGNTINGKVTVEKYLSPRKGWRFISVPTNTAQTIRQAWQESANGNNSNPVPGFGIQITGGTSATWAADGFDLYSSTPSMKKYNPSTNSWLGIANTNATNVKSTDGYMMFVRGDRSSNAFNSPVTQTVVRTKGELFSGNLSPVHVSPGKFAAIGNPYASTLDMRSIQKSGLKNFFYVWDPQLGGATGYGGFQTFTFNGSNYVVTPGMGSYGPNGSVHNYIESGMAFLVEANASGGTLTFNENAKYQAPAREYIDSTFINPSLKVNLIGIAADNSTYMCDGLLVEYNDQFSNALDELDGVKSTNTAENLGIRNGNAMLVVERRKTITANDTIYLNLANTKAQQYRFEIQGSVLEDGRVSAFVEDNYLHTITPVNNSGVTAVNFTIVNVPGSYAQDRFRIIFKPVVVLPVKFVSIKAIVETRKVIVSWKVTHESNLKHYAVERSTDGHTFSTMQIKNPANNGCTICDYNVIDENPATGNNYYRVKSVDADNAMSYSPIVKVAIAKKASQVMLNTNVIINRSVTLQFEAMPKGKYKALLVNTAGQYLFETEINYSGGYEAIPVKFPHELAKGVYQLLLLNEDNGSTSLKLIK